jgi:hypothetical protein
MPTVLDGQLPEAARFYPSAGGQADEDALWPHLLETIPHAALVANPPCRPAAQSRFRIVLLTNLRTYEFINNNSSIRHYVDS